ncbi:monomethylamine:corrinoid methyltransferase [Methanosarcina sp. KYL-1]|uniref:monomethylamine:corrinoid methyltransferase n=1 Tax=Methanosarcina sp. KYL-1 TaxID=2602068 RepID=UPI00210082E9|nr:monomethylamine:corrinoid methyltransferase [Methanosarcina sp. KYL-1]MCQ1534413.1 monomethylamine:corrinoid methyltransferase [Methanosarcina sp. KYL-1]
MEYFISKMLNGKERTESEHERLIYRNSLELVEAHDLTFDPEYPVPVDMRLADRVFSAALNLLEEVGVYSTDTKRVVEFSKSEMRQCIRNSPFSFRIGSNADSTEVRFRNVLDERTPLIIGGPCAVPITDDLFLPVHRSYAKINRVDSVAPASYHCSEYPRYRLKKSPLNMYEAHKAVKLIKEACRVEGRPDICCVSPPFIDDVRTALSISDPQFMGRGDLEELYPKPDLKADLDQMARVIHYRGVGVYYVSSSMLLMGGITSATPEQFAIEMTAEILKSRILYSCPLSFVHPNHLRSPASRSLEVLWASFITSMAITRNSDLLHGIVVNNSSGPCTESMMYETAVQTIGSTVCGADSLSGPVSNAGNELNHAAGLDALFMAAVSELSVSLSLKDANDLCLILFNEYRDKKPEFGKKFDECYDLSRIEPSEEYLDIYERAMEHIYELISESL